MAKSRSFWGGRKILFRALGGAWPPGPPLDPPVPRDRIWRPPGPKMAPLRPKNGAPSAMCPPIGDPGSAPVQTHKQVEYGTLKRATKARKILSLSLVMMYHVRSLIAERASTCARETRSGLLLQWCSSLPTADKHLFTAIYHHISTL